MDRLKQIELFVMIAKLGSLSQAAERLAMSNAAASRHLTALEESLGVRLVERTTRRLWVTEAGARYLVGARTMLGAYQQAGASVAEVAGAPSGLLRVTASLSFAVQHLAPLMPAFRQRYPTLRVEVVVANRYPDFIEAGIDVAIRTREHEATSGIAMRPLAETRRILCASPGYLARRGRPARPADLTGHEMMIYTLANNPYELSLERGEERQTVRVNSTFDSNDGQVLRTAAIAGLGILILPMYIVFDDVVAGRLVPVMEDWELPSLTINIAYQSRTHLPAKVRVFIDFLVERFERLDFKRRWSGQARVD